MELRRGTVADTEAIVAVFVPSFATLTFLPTLHTIDEHRAFFGGVVLAKQEVWVAEEDGRVLGFAALDGDMLSFLYIHPDAHGQGIGSALLERAKERRPEGFTFWVFQQNEQARRFYERHGCAVVRFTDGSGNEERTPDALYEWRASATAR
jgi:GNAT superfamily N-acetyltransferase